MGCCGSNTSKLSYPEILPEERTIEAQEKLLVFSQRKLVDLLYLIEKIDYKLDIYHFSHLCYHFKVQPSSPTEYFLSNLIKKGLLDSHLLRNISILLSEADSNTKVSLIFSHDKKIFINNIKNLLMTAIEVIPNNIENVESCVIKYSQNLRMVAEKYINELHRINIVDIMAQVENNNISSKDLRIKMHYDMKNSDIQNFENNVPLSVLIGSGNFKLENESENDERFLKFSDMTESNIVEKNSENLSELEDHIELLDEVNDPVFSICFSKFDSEEHRAESIDYFHSLLEYIPIEPGLEKNTSDDSLLRYFEIEAPSPLKITTDYNDKCNLSNDLSPALPKEGAAASNCSEENKITIDHILKEEEKHKDIEIPHLRPSKIKSPRLSARPLQDIIEKFDQKGSKIGKNYLKHELAHKDDEDKSRSHLDVKDLEANPHLDIEKSVEIHSNSNKATESPAHQKHSEEEFKATKGSSKIGIGLESITRSDILSHSSPIGSPQQESKLTAFKPKKIS